MAQNYTFGKYSVRTFVILFFAASVAVAQPDTALVRIKALKSDTERVNELYKKGFSIRNADPVKAFGFARECEKEALECSSLKHLAKSYNLLGVLFYKKGELGTAHNYHQKALKLRRECSDETGIAHSLTNLGNIYLDLKLFHKAEACYLEALKIYELSNNERQKAACLLNLGTLKQYTKQMESAREFYQLANKLAEHNNDYETRCLCLNNLAEYYFDKGENETSIGYNMDALKLRNLMDNQVDCADSYLNLSKNYIQMNDAPRAKTYLDMAYKIANQYDYFEARMEACKTYAWLYESKDNFAEAFHWLSEYNVMLDSLMQQQDLEKSAYNLQDTLDETTVAEPRGLKNKWMLMLLGVSAVVIVYFLTRNKR